MTSGTGEAERTSSGGRGGSASLLVAAVISGLAGYGVLVLAARTLSGADNARFLVFWGAMFVVFGVLNGVTTEATRAVHAAGDGTGHGVRLVPVGIGFGAGIAVVTALSGLLWGPHLFNEHWPVLLSAMTVGIGFFAFHANLTGVFSGQRDWSRYAFAIAVEPSVRVLLCTACAVVGAGLTTFAWASAVPAATLAVLALVLARFRRLLSVRVDLDALGLLRRLLTACTAAGVSALLLVGYPVLLKATTPDDVFAGAAPLILAASLCRAPLMVPLGAYQNVVVTRVYVHGVRALVPIVALLSGVTGVGMLAGWRLGPFFLHLVNPDYHVDGAVFAGLVLGAGLVAALTVTGAAAVALDHHTVYLAGWIAATVAALAVLLVPWGLETRVVVSLVVGPLVGVAVHLGLGRQRIS